MFDLKQFMAYLLGDKVPLETLAGAWVWGMFGAFMSILIDATTRDVLKDSSPIQFSQRYFIVNNAFRFFKSAFVLLVVVRFSENLFGAPISQWLAFFAGLAIDRVIDYIRDLKKKGPNTITPNNDQP